jgi:uncharacterized protein (TIGR03435 family)
MPKWQFIATATLLAAAMLRPMGSLSQPAGASRPPQAPAKRPDWDVISVRPIQVQNCNQGSGWRPLTDGVTFFCAPLVVVIETAYGIMEPSRILGAPDWVKNLGFYDIDAKVSGEDVVAYGKLAAEDKNRMLQSLLGERFHLKAHIEQREIPVYELVLAKDGPKLKEATANEAGKASIISRRGKVECVSMPLTSLPWILNSEVGRPVMDKTGLAGKYDFTLDYVPAAKAATDDSGGPSIFTALQEQLGLRLEPAKAPMDVLVIDAVERPAAN